MGQQAREDLRLDRLDLLAESRQRATPYALEDLGVAPFTARPTGLELSFQEPADGGELFEQTLRRLTAQRVSGGELVGGERTMGSCVAAGEVGGGIGCRLLTSRTATKGASKPASSPSRATPWRIATGD